MAGSSACRPPPRRPRLSTAEEEAAERQGELEAHAQDLQQQLIKAQSRLVDEAKRDGETKKGRGDGGGWIQGAAAEEIVSMKRELADVKSKITKESWASDSSAVLQSYTRWKPSVVEASGACGYEDCCSHEVDLCLMMLGVMRGAQEPPSDPDPRSGQARAGTVESATPRATKAAQGSAGGAASAALALGGGETALDRANLDVKRHSEHVQQLKMRSKDLQEMMSNMDKARWLVDLVGGPEAVEAGDRRVPSDPEDELQKAKAKKADLDAKALTRDWTTWSCACR
eukprot:Skav225790  [mRNA]  locus=scaffold2147:122890:132100:+ [translate_table: standard]